MTAVAGPRDQVLGLMEAGRLGEAAECCRTWLGSDPDRAEAHHLLGLILARRGDLEAAAPHFERAVVLEPGNVAAINGIGNAYWQLGRVAEAAEYYRRALGPPPHNPAVMQNLANALLRLGRPGAAAELFSQVLARGPGSAEARFGLANALGGLSRHAEALALYEDLARTHPDFPGLKVNQGLALMKLGRCDAAIARYDEALAANPEDYQAHNNRANALRQQQRMDEAIAGYRRALTIRPEHATAHSNLLLTLNYTETRQDLIYREALRFDAVQAAGLAPVAPEFSQGRDPDRVLRVGYVSADFRRHSVADFTLAVLAAHDRARVEVCCYSGVENPDAVTARFEATADLWRPILGRPDGDVAEQIRADRIDILVDLAGHTGGNRLLVFARRPAPVQVTWLGFPNTTGLKAMDYRLTDAIADPPGEADAEHSERLVRLPGGFLCYHPDESLAGHDAVERTGPEELTFGSFNVLSKLTPEVLRVWAEILIRIPGSRLLLKSEALEDGETRSRFLGTFKGLGVGPERIELLPWIRDYAAHMALYSRVDLALDPFPYNGTTTTCEALWMGVPVVTLRGGRHAARVGASILAHAGLPEWVAGSEAEYIGLATSRAADRSGLAAARKALSTRVRTSGLTDTLRFTAELEGAFRDLWRKWCASGAP